MKRDNAYIEIRQIIPAASGTRAAVVIWDDDPDVPDTPPHAEYFPIIAWATMRYSDWEKDSTEVRPLAYDQHNSCIGELVLLSDFNQDSNAYFVRICFDGMELSAQEISDAAEHARRFRRLQQLQVHVTQ